MGVTMRGGDGIYGSLSRYIDLEKRVPADHPLRVIRQIAIAALKSLSSEFAKLYSPIGRESIPPERLMRALLLQAFYSIRSERELVERINNDLLFRWFVGLGIEDAGWDATSFTKNRDRLLDGAVAGQFLAAVLSQDKVQRLLSSEHFSVDGTLLDAWASPKSFRPKHASSEPPGPGRNRERDFHGERRENDTHVSTTDPDARLYREGPGKEARLCFMGHAALMENRNGLIVGAVKTRASGHAERLAALTLIEPHPDRPPPVTLGARQGLRHRRFRHGAAREGGHTACRSKHQRSPFGDRRPHHPPFRLCASQRIRKRVEEAFGWAKAVAGLRKMRHRGLPKVGWQFTLAMAAYNHVRLPKLLIEPAP
jgi:transposase